MIPTSLENLLMTNSDRSQSGMRVLLRQGYGGQSEKKDFAPCTHYNQLLLLRDRRWPIR
jgi:hypothetical protein